MAFATKIPEQHCSTTTLLTAHMTDEERIALALQGLHSDSTPSIKLPRFSWASLVFNMAKMNSTISASRLHQSIRAVHMKWQMTTEKTPQPSMSNQVSNLGNYLPAYKIHAILPSCSEPRCACLAQVEQLPNKWGRTTGSQPTMACRKGRALGLLSMCRQSHHTSTRYKRCE